MKLEKITARGVNNLYREVTTQTIYFRQHRKGKEIKRSLKTKNIERAKELADEVRKELGMRPERKVLKQTLWELWQEWLSAKEILGKTRPNTFTSIHASGKYFEPYFETMLPASLLS